MAGSELALATRLLDRDPRAIARAISLIENEEPAAVPLLAAIHPSTGRAYLIGVTGPPGAGKSTLVDRMTAHLRRAGKTVGVLAVDPTSPYTGGAVLGDRVRMQGHAEDAGVFIRSMATRGHLGGLARTTVEAALVLDAAGFDVVIIETVGVGQDEVDIVRTADVAIVTLVPGAGDEVQALKAGIMEIADIFVVNKADREGADRTAASIETMLSLEEWPTDAWRPPVLRTVATTGTGIAELMAGVDRFRDASGKELGARRRSRVEWRLREILERRFMLHLERAVLEPGEFDRLLDRIANRELDPYGAAASVLARALEAGSRMEAGSLDPATLPGSKDPGLRRAMEAGSSDPAEGHIDHLGVAATDASDLVRLFETLFGFRTGEPEDVGQHRIRFVETGDTTIEIVEPRTPEAAVAKFLHARGPGLHHVCLRVKDIDRAMATLREKGVRFVDDAPRPGAHGSRIAFLHPTSVGGLLVELKQKAD